MFGSVGLPHGFCFLWNPQLLWLHVLSDSLIALAYFLIPVALVGIARKRRDIPYNWMFFCFGTFIVACGLTHVMEVVTLWHPIYWISGWMKALTAVASLATFGLLLGLTPAILKIPTRRELEAVNEQLNSVLENTSVGVIAVDRSWKIDYLNSNASEQLKVGQEVIGKVLWEQFPGNAETTIARLEEVMATRKPASFESYYAPADLSSNLSVHSWKDGGLTIFFVDVSEQRRLERELEREKAMREQRVEALAHMAGGLAHEISNPLGIIHARASDLAETAAEMTSVPAEMVTSACASIVRTSDRATRILRGLRVLAREGSKEPMQAVPVVQMVEQTVELVIRRYQTHGITLDLQIAEDLPLIMCREVQIEQILLNLLNNAFDAIDEAANSERWVRIQAGMGQVSSGDQRAVVIDVVDGGPGVAPENRRHVMEAFFTTKAVGAGIGVGLSLSKAIAEDHGGTLELTEVEAHTCFRLTLPVEQQRQEGAAA